MPLIRKKIDAVVAANPKPADGSVFVCGLAAPAVYVIDVGNQAGSVVVDARFELVPPTRRLDWISLISVDVLDDTHLTLTCQCTNDSQREIAPIRIFVLIES